MVTKSTVGALSARDAVCGVVGVVDVGIDIGDGVGVRCRSCLSTCTLLLLLFVCCPCHYRCPQLHDEDPTGTLLVLLSYDQWRSANLHEGADIFFSQLRFSSCAPPPWVRPAIAAVAGKIVCLIVLSSVETSLYCHAHHGTRAYLRSPLGQAFESGRCCKGRLPSDLVVRRAGVWYGARSAGVVVEVPREEHAHRVNNSVKVTLKRG